MKRAISLLIILLFSGCASIQEICTGYGFTPGTTEFANCNMSEMNSRRQAWQNFNNQLQENNRQYQRSLDQIYNNNSNSYSNSFQDNTIRLETNCHTSPDYGAGTYTSCY